MREQFLVELYVPGRALDGVDELNRLFTAWVETVYHRRVHSETGQTPLARLAAAPPPTLPTPVDLRDAFLWSETRTVTKTATVSLHGNVYVVDAALVGRRIELVLPEDRRIAAAVPSEPGERVSPHLGSSKPHGRCG